MIVKLDQLSLVCQVSLVRSVRLGYLGQVNQDGQGQLEISQDSLISLDQIEKVRYVSQDRLISLDLIEKVSKLSQFR